MFSVLFSGWEQRLKKQPYLGATYNDLWILLNVRSVIQTSGRASFGNIYTRYKIFHILVSFSNFRSLSRHLSWFLVTDM